MPLFQKLFQIVSHEAPYCKWNKDGDNYCVVARRVFSQSFTQYFKSNNFSSFVRQLHFYGFRKTDKDKNSWEFQHAKFLRGQPKLLTEITRKTCSDYNGNANNNSSEIELLKTEVAKLRTEMKETRAACQQANTIILTMIKEGGFHKKLRDAARELVENPYKKRRLVTFASETNMSGQRMDRSPRWETFPSVSEIVIASAILLGCSPKTRFSYQTFRAVLGTILLGPPAIGCRQLEPSGWLDRWRHQCLV